MESEERKLTKRLEKARSSGKLESVIACCRRLAEYQSLHGHYEKALSLFREELRACEAKGDCRDIANANRMIGEMCCTLGMFEESLSYVNKYLTFARDEKDSVEEQRALATLGRTYFCWAVHLQPNALSLQDKSLLQQTLISCRKAYTKSLYICEHLTNIGNHERQEMKARLLFNLGLACEVEGQLEEALKYVHNSITICRKENFLEDLHRCYISQISIYLKCDNSSLALKAADDAIDIAKKLTDHIQYTVLALYHKSEVYFAIANYRAAKKVLKKAFKMKTPNDEERESVESFLKYAILLCNLEDKLAVLPEDSFSEKKKLYEKFGDICCALKNFKLAVEYYLKMLNCAETLGESEEHLLPCYVSLAQTYRDVKNYDCALLYARKELQISQRNPLEAAKTHITIGEILEMSNAPFCDIEKEYTSARKYAEKANNDSVLVSSLRRLSLLLRANNFNDKADEMDKIIAGVGDVDSSDSEDDVRSISESSVHLSNLSDSEEDMPRTSKKSFKVTRNEKGETPLHVAAIKGDVNRARRLIALGHPVKERDLAGWTPLHEAANHGHFDMVKLLIESGADVNDPGGRECGGVTPLHDSACCGHFEIIRFLMEKGAAVTLLTNDGETALDCLTGWRERVDDLDDCSQKVYEGIVRDLEAGLAAAGVQKTSSQKKNRKERDNFSVRNREPVMKRITQNSVDFGGMRRNREWDDQIGNRQWRSVSPTDSDTDEIISENSISLLKINSPLKRKGNSINFADRENSISDYRNTIDALRKRPKPTLKSKPQIDTPLLNEDSYVDDWLDDDININSRQKYGKRKIVDLLERDGIRQTEENNEKVSDWGEQDVEKMTSIPDIRASKKSRINTVTESASTSTDVEDSQNTSFVTNNIDFPNISSPPLSSVSDQTAPCKIRVNVGNHTFLVAVDSAKTEELTIRWLAEDVAKRYCSLEGCEPTLLLKTNDGAILDFTDPLTVAIGEEVQCHILDWKTESLTERYIYAWRLEVPDESYSFGCYRLGPDEAVIAKLESFLEKPILDLQYFCLQLKELRPIFKAIQQVRFIEVLDLSGNVLCDSGLSQLLKAVENCIVEHLFLRCNHITEKGLRMFCNALETTNKDFIVSLKTLDLSFNPLGDNVDDVLSQMRSKLTNCSEILLNFTNEP